MATQPAGNDAVTADQRHYTVEFENDKVRVLRAKYGPREKSRMHTHPALVAVLITDANVRFTYPDGRTEDVSMSRGQVVNMTAVEHLPENLSDQPFEIILLEVKE
jgi:hypothetical protein